MDKDLDAIINEMLEIVRDVRAIPELRQDEVEREVQKRLLDILEAESSRDF
ncbi:MAG: hypothetical protein QF441_08910 [Bacteriovoracaceae bacterium]|jgi:hypothetical protein|nr:hypothetical protein [Bacteriovoracaceae bacterium]